MILELVLYMSGSITFFIALGYILWRTKIDRFVTVAFVMQSIILVTVAMWESLIIGVVDDILYNMGVWFFTFGTLLLMLIILYFVHINLSSPKPPPGSTYRKKFIKEALYFAFLVYGTNWFVGTWFSDFGYFLINGLHLFNPEYVYWMPFWIGGVFPLVYFQSLIGLILMVVGFRHFFKIRNKAPPKTDTSSQDLSD